MENDTNEPSGFYTGPIEQFPDHSIRLLLQDAANVRGLIDIVAGELAARLDFSRLTHVNPNFILDNLREQEADLVYRLPFQGAAQTKEVHIYILIEHQSTVDTHMAFRLLFYMVNLWDTQRREWHAQQVPSAQRRFQVILPIVLYTGDRPWHTPLRLSAMMDVPKELEACVPTFEPFFLNVKSSEKALLTATGDAFGWLLTVLQKERGDKTEFTAAIQEAIPHINRLDAAEAERWKQAILYLFQLITHRRPKEEREELNAVLSQQIRGQSRTKEVETMVETWAQHLFEQGKTEGITKGRAEGRAEGITEGEELGKMSGKREVLLKLLHRQFADVPDDITLAINATESHARLDALVDEALNAETLDDIEWDMLRK